MLRLNGKKIVPTIFPDKTSQVWNIPASILIEYSSFAQIEWSFESEAEFMHLAQLVSLLKSRNLKIRLNIKYLPYGRQDKDVSNDATFALRTFLKLLGTLDIERIICLDPHSDLAYNYMYNFHAYYPSAELYKAYLDTGSELVCYPDKGALTKYRLIYGYFIQDYIHGEKVRDQATGRITSYKLVGDPKDKKVLIVDDICDGGATFILLAKELLDAGATEVNLFVTHGIFSKGLGVLVEAGIKHIYTHEGEKTVDKLHE
jgi:ribose-phosphate pyrophosphokinase